MLVLYFLMGALALLVTVLLFGFVGCKPFGAADTPNPEPPAAPPGPAPGPGSPPPPDYGQYGNWVTRTKDLVAYWRLGEPSGTTVLKASDPIPAGAVKTAKDTFNGYDGYYFSLNPAANPDNARHSPKTAGTITLGVTPGLLEVAPQDNYSCIQVDGGFVQVGWDNHLNPQAFTLEAWVYPDSTMYNPAPGASQFYYCLVEAAGPKGLGQKKTGWGLYLGPDGTIISIPRPLPWRPGSIPIQPCTTRRPGPANFIAAWQNQPARRGWARKKPAGDFTSGRKLPWRRWENCSGRSGWGMAPLTRGWPSPNPIFPRIPRGM